MEWSGAEQEPTAEQTTNCQQDGKLQIILPDGVTIEEQTAEQDMRVIDFIGMGNFQNRPFPPRIWFAHYHAEYENICALISQLLDLLPSSSLELQYHSDDECCWLFVYTKPYQNGYVLLYKTDVYIVEEISAEKDYSFGELLDNEAILLENDAYNFTEKQSYGFFTIYNKIKVEEDISFLVLQSLDANRVWTIQMFSDGYFFNTCHEFVFEEWEGETEFQDCNFDGCLDMIVSPTNIYLWNADKKAYEAAQIPEELPGERKCYPETQTIWGYKREYVKDADGQAPWDFDHTEMLWKWEGTVLVKKRECVAQVRSEGARIWACEDNQKNVLFDETFTVKAWEENIDAVQKRYQQFYAGMVPEDVIKMDYLNKGSG